MSILGIFLAGQVPGAWGLEFAAILALIALTVPMLNSKPGVVGALVAAVVAVAAAGLPLKLGLVVAVIAGISAALAVDIALERVERV
jgi:predicted branched-subunit amino acid permease